MDGATATATTNKQKKTQIVFAFFHALNDFFLDYVFFTFIIRLPVQHFKSHSIADLHDLLFDAFFVVSHDHLILKMVKK